VCVYVCVCVYLSLQCIVKVSKPTTILADLKISKTIGLSSAREREKVKGRIHVHIYIAGISSQYYDGGKNVKIQWRGKLLTGSKDQAWEYGGLCQIQICQTMYVHMIAYTYDCAYECVRT